MQLIALVLHSIDKAVGSESTVRLREATLTIDNRAEQFVTALRTAYSKKSNTYWGIFNSDTELYPFQDRLSEYLDGGDFLAFTERAMRMLKKEIDSKTLATGGYVVFAHYENDGSSYVICSMLQDKDGFSVDSETLDLKDTPYLNIDQVRVAGRVNTSTWTDLNNNGNYVSFLRGGSELSLYFQEFIGCTENTSSKDLSRRLLRAVDAHLDALQLSREDVEYRKSKVIDYVIANIDKGDPVRLDSVAPLVDEDNPDAFVERAVSEEYAVSTVFRAHKRTMQEAIYHTLKSNEMRIRFNASLFNRTVHWNPDTNIVSINAPEEWRAELEQLARLTNE